MITLTYLFFESLFRLIYGVIWTINNMILTFLPLLLSLFFQKPSLCQCRALSLNILKKGVATSRL